VWLAVAIVVICRLILDLIVRICSALALAHPALAVVSVMFLPEHASVMKVGLVLVARNLFAHLCKIALAVVFVEVYLYKILCVSVKHLIPAPLVPVSVEMVPGLIALVSVTLASKVMVATLNALVMVSVLAPSTMVPVNVALPRVIWVKAGLAITVRSVHVLAF